MVAIMGLNIKNPVVEALVTEVARMTGESKTEAIRRALEERRQRLAFQIIDKDRARRLKELLELEIWPLVSERERGRRLTRDEEEKILGIAKDGA